MLTTLDISNYRSLRVFVRPQRLNVATRPNGSGKLNLYRSASLAGEGGVQLTV